MGSILRVWADCLLIVSLSIAGCAIAAMMVAGAVTLLVRGL
jgi:hypothetical protein